MNTFVEWILNPYVLFFIGVTVVCALIWHKFLKHMPLATFGAALTATILYQILNYVYLGYLDPFFMIAFFTSMLLAIFISLIIGILFMIWRGKQHNQSLKHGTPPVGGAP